MLSPVTFAGTEAGPKFLALGAVHGNEKCGTVAINRVIAEIEAGKLKIARGQVTFVPICNPRAYERDVRFTERNLNRYLVPMTKPDCYEAELGNELCPLLEKCDMLLDIHSYTVGGAPFISAGDDPKDYVFAASLGDYAILTGWQDAYAATGRKKAVRDKEEGTGTTEYARRFGTTGLTLECGQHKDPKAPDVAYSSIRNALRYLGLTTETSAAKPAAQSRIVAFTRVYYRDDEGKFPKPWKNLERVAKGEPMAFHANGTPVTAPSDGFIIMPKAEAALGEEWFYFGVEKKA